MVLIVSNTISDSVRPITAIITCNPNISQHCQHTRLFTLRVHVLFYFTLQIFSSRNTQPLDSDLRYDFV